MKGKGLVSFLFIFCSVFLLRQAAGTEETVEAISEGKSHDEDIEATDIGSENLIQSSEDTSRDEYIGATDIESENLIPSSEGKSRDEDIEATDIDSENLFQSSQGPSRDEDIETTDIETENLIENSEDKSDVDVTTHLKEALDGEEDSEPEPIVLSSDSEPDEEADADDNPVHNLTKSTEHSKASETNHLEDVSGNEEEAAPMNPMDFFLEASHDEDTEETGIELENLIESSEDTVEEATDETIASTTGDQEEYKSSFVEALKHLSHSLIGFLPEALQDSVLDVSDALILTGIIALTLVSICVPYFFIESYMAVRPLKKQVVELNKNLWKVSTAYENQQEDYEAYKAKALAYDEEKDTIEKLETELHLIKQLDVKSQELIKKLQKEQRYSSKYASQVEELMKKTISEKNTAVEELEKLKGYLMTLQAKYKLTNETLEAAKSESMNSTVLIDELNHDKNLLELKITALEKDVSSYRALIQVETDKRKLFETSADTYFTERNSLTKDLSELRTILHQYEDTVNNLSQEISLKENELMSLKESLGDDSPLVEAAELSAKLKASEENATALQLRVDSLTLEHGSLSQNLERLTKSAAALETEKSHAENKLQVLESYFKEKEEELRTMVEKYESEKLTRGMDKEGLISMIEEKEDIIRDLNRRITAMKQELEDTKLSHRNELRAIEAKEHENWLLLCQSERKLQESRKDGELLRQKLTALSKEREEDDGGFDDLDGNMNIYPIGLIPPPLDDIEPTYIGLSGLESIIPPLPLDDDENDDDLNSPRRDREPLRLPPLGRLSPTFSDNGPLSPIGGYSSGSSSPQRRPPSRESWINGNDRGSDNRGHPRTSSPIHNGVNV